MDLGDVELELRNECRHLQVAWYNGGQVLVSLLTSEVAALPMRPSLWSLSEDDEGECYLDHGEDVQWASDILRQPLFREPAFARLCVVRQGKQVMVGDLVAERFAASAASYVVDGVGDVCLEVFGWHCARNGSKLWWNALRVHKALKLQCHKRDSARWAEHG